MVLWTCSKPSQLTQMITDLGNFFIKRIEFDPFNILEYQWIVFIKFLDITKKFDIRVWNLKLTPFVLISERLLLNVEPFPDVQKLVKVVLDHILDLNQFCFDGNSQASTIVAFIKVSLTYVLFKGSVQVLANLIDQSNISVGHFTVKYHFNILVFMVASQTCIKSWKDNFYIKNQSDRICEV